MNAITVSKARRAVGVIVLTMLGFIALTVASPAYAQCSGSGNTERAIAAATSVFVGRVAETSDAGRVAQVQVLAIWKGRDLPEVVEVRGTSGTAGTIDRRFDAAKTYLFVPENARAPFLASACSATQSFVGPANIVPTAYQDAVGATAGRIISSSPDNGELEAGLVRSILPLLAMIGLIAVVWMVIARLRSLEPERAMTFAEPISEAVETEPRRRLARRRNMKRDLASAAKAKRRTIRRNNRGFWWYRRRQRRQLAAARKARGSTDTS